MSKYDDGYTDGFDIIDRWFDSDVWKTIVNDADNDDRDSLDFMQTVSEDLNSLIWHMQNNSGHERVVYELGKFQKLINDYEL
tara:strand:- start:279 stop:524 length:246 start_codon:yes stop_codon:yes gene_type:complete